MRKIFILHGWTYSLDKWSEFVGFLRKWGLKVEFIKIPGLTRESNEVWDLKKYTGWLNNLLVKEKKRVVLLGHSNGGRIALAFAAKYPEKVKKLILIDSAAVFHNELLIKIKRSVFRIVAKAGKKFTNSGTLRKLLYKLAQEQDYAKASPNMRKTMVNLLNTDLRQIFGRIKASTLIIWGERDQITPVSDARLLKKLIKNSKLEIIKGARHSPFYTHARKVAKIVYDF